MGFFEEEQDRLIAASFERAVSASVSGIRSTATGDAGGWRTLCGELSSPIRRWSDGTSVTWRRDFRPTQ